MRQLTCILILLAGLMASCGTESRGAPKAPAAPGSTERICTHMGGFDSFVCRYELEELTDLDEVAAVQARGFLHEDSSGLYLVSGHSGSDTTVRLGELNGEAAETWFVEALLGHLTSVRGIYRPDTHVIDVRSMRWVEEEGAPPPEFKARGSRD